MENCGPTIQPVPDVLVYALTTIISSPWPTRTYVISEGLPYVFMTAADLPDSRHYHLELPHKVYYDSYDCPKHFTLEKDADDISCKHSGCPTSKCSKYQCRSARESLQRDFWTAKYAPRAMKLFGMTTAVVAV